MSRLPSTSGILAVSLLLSNLPILFSAFPDHFLQLNTLMFQKKTVVKNNQITPMVPISLPGMEKMSGQEEDDRLANRALPPLPVSLLFLTENNS